MSAKLSTSQTNRWFVISVALAVALIGTIFYVNFFWELDQVHFEDSAAKYPLIDPARHLIEQEHFLSTLQPLRERIFALVNTQSDLKIGIYIEYLNTGSNISVNNDAKFWPASLSKVPLALAVMGTIQRNIWTLDQVLTLEENDRTDQSSSLYTHPVGTQFTVRRLLDELLIRSDNTAYRILLRNVPVSELNAVREGIGLEDLFTEDGRVSAKEYARIFRSLYTASYLNRAQSEYLLEVLDKAEFNEFLSASVPDSVPFPHKYGLFPQAHTYNDIGIVYLEKRPYIIGVFIEGDDTVRNRERIPQIMRSVSNMAFQFFSTEGLEKPLSNL